MKKLIPLLLGNVINTLSYVAPSYAAKLGFRVFCFPIRGTLKPYHHAFLNTAEKSTIKHPKQDIQVYRWGNGSKKILFLHGWQSHSFRWKNYIECFPSEEYTCYALDAPGHGLSKGSFLTVPLYSEVIEQFFHEHGNIEAIVAHSLGAFTTVYTLHRLPLLPVHKLVLLAPPGEATEFVQFYQTSLKLSNRTMRLVRSYFEDIIGHKVEYFMAQKFAESLNQSGLIIHDEEDDDTPHRHSLAIHKAWKKSKLKITKGLGHNLKSEIILAEVSDFIKGLEVTAKKTEVMM
jgi:pimeloyl-ACP methyl ester carboxylesterase